MSDKTCSRHERGCPTRCPNVTVEDFEPLSLDEGDVQAFRDRLQVLLTNPKWFKAHWYTDEDFIRAFRTCLDLKAENERLLQELAELRTDNNRLADLLGSALARTPESYRQPILQILEHKAADEARNKGNENDPDNM